ncbi:MAG: hypothetical protein H0X43_01200 [Nitrosospira sp.]|nr:hypothetical protein [Nitrosospira sp.]
MSTSLEDERKALLERMSASRQNYRFRLIPARDEENQHGTGNVYRDGKGDKFPRSRTFKFVTRHPYYTSLALLGVLSAFPSRSLSRAMKGGIALTAGILGSSARTLLVRQVLPSMVRSFRSRKR